MRNPFRPASINTADPFYTGPAAILYFFPSGSIPESMRWRFGSSGKSVKSAGPANQRGLLVTPFHGMLNYDPERQTWRKLRDFYIGWRKDLQPEHLARASNDLHHGYAVTLGDGNSWDIPVAFADSPHFSFPRVSTIDDAGNWLRKVQDKFIFVCDCARMLWDQAQSDAAGTVIDIPEDKQRMVCTAALSVNYDLTPDEAGVMELLTDAGIQGIFEAILDTPGIKEIAAAYSEAEAQKKTSVPAAIASGVTA